ENHPGRALIGSFAISVHDELMIRPKIPAHAIQRVRLGGPEFLDTHGGSRIKGGYSPPPFRGPFERRTTMIARTIAVLLVAVSMLTGQTTNATLRGAISDQSGAVLPGVTISVKNQGTGVERTTLSDETGNYQVAALPVGLYQIEVRLQGMKTQIVSGLALEVG